MDFVEIQQAAWCEIVTEMMRDATFRAINGGTVNGPGASLEYTHHLREALPDLLRRYGISTMLDAPCGDLTWIAQTDLSMLHSYVGVDVEERIIGENKVKFHDHPKMAFVCTNLLTRKKLPKVDLILCRHFLQHLTTEYISVVLDKFLASGSTFLLASNYPGSSNAFDYDDPGGYPWLGYLERPHDLSAPPFNLDRIDGIAETTAPGGIIAREHELALFRLC